MKNLPQRFYSLDVLRGLAALIVVLFHWQNFFTYKYEYPRLTLLPLHQILAPFYTSGGRAVDLFFCLSGFIFFWLYSEKIRSQSISAKEFGVLRFSRLYPLHLVTLVLVALGQVVMCLTYGSSFVYRNNDAFHYVIQLFFASALTANEWQNNSFNGPNWSVSVEIFLYGLFFIVCRCKCIRWWQILAYIAVGEYWVVHHGHYIGFARGVLSFFIGGFSFHIFVGLWNLRLSNSVYTVMGCAVLLLWVLIPLEVANSYLVSTYESVFAHQHLEIFKIIGKGVYRFSQGAYELVLFPLTIILLALVETRRGTLGRRFAILGDISYSTYLLHFPLQILFMIAVFAVGATPGFFSSVWGLPIFFAVLIPISIGSHNIFERPAQSSLRCHLLQSGKPDALVAKVS
jgi:peptidoglycan/LPS O-acetylase OafA/YrhL